jgi:hypothetical protein
MIAAPLQGAEAASSLESCSLLESAFDDAVMTALLASFQ